MTRMNFVALFLMIVAAACDSNPHPATVNAHVVAANALTREYAQSRLARWSLKARAAGSDCDVLFVETPMILDDALVEALHYGAGAYAIHIGGVDRFCRERAFRGTAYRDRSGRVRTFGEVGSAEAAGLKPCR